MAAKRKITYDGAISTFMQKHFSHCRMNKSGRELIADILQDIHSSLIKNFENEYESTKEITDSAVIKCAEKAVTKTLPTDIRHHAMAEANRQLMLFQSGELEYDHVTSIKELKSLPEYNEKRKKTAAEGEIRRPRTPYHPFTSAASKVVSTMYSGLKLEKDAKQFLGFHLCKLTNQIAQRAAENAAGRPQLDCSDVRNSLHEFLGSEVLKLAYAEGNRNLFEHIHGLHVFRPRKPSISAQPLLVVDEAIPGAKKTRTKETKDLLGTPILKAHSSAMFRNGIRKLLSETANIYPPPKIDEGSKRVSEILFSVADFISNRVAERSRNDRLTEIDFTDVKEVINEIFPQILLDHAVYYGFGNVKDYLKGTLRYRKRPPPTSISSTPKRKRVKTESPRKRSKSKAKPTKRLKVEKELPKHKKKDEPSKTQKKGKVKPKELNFSKGILDFVQQSLPSSTVSVGREGTERINKLLLDVCKSLIAVSAGQHTSLTAKTIRITAESFFPREIGRHALAAADRFLCVHEPTVPVTPDTPPGRRNTREGSMQLTKDVPNLWPVFGQDIKKEDEAQDETLDETLPTKEGTTNG